MSNKYLEKAAFIGATLGAISGYKSSDKKDSAFGRTSAGAVAGHTVATGSRKIWEHAANKGAELARKGKVHAGHGRVLAATGLAAGLAGTVGASFAGKGAGVLYDKTKDKINGK